MDNLEVLDNLLKACAPGLVPVRKQVVREGKPYYKEVCEYPEGKGERFEKHPKDMSNEELSRIINVHGDTKDKDMKQLVDRVVDEYKKRRATMNKAMRNELDPKVRRIEYLRKAEILNAVRALVWAP